MSSLSLSEQTSILSKINQNWKFILTLPEHQLLEKFVLAAIKQYWAVIAYLPKSCHTETIGLASYKLYSGALYYVSPSILTPQFFSKIQQIGSKKIVHTSLIELYSFPASTFTLEFCEANIIRNSSFFEFLPVQYRTPEINLSAICWDPGNFWLLTEQERTLEIKLAALENGEDTVLRTMTPKEQSEHFNSILSSIEKYPIGSIFCRFSEETGVDGINHFYNQIIRHLLVDILTCQDKN